MCVRAASSVPSSVLRSRQRQRLSTCLFVRPVFACQASTFSRQSLPKFPFPPSKNPTPHEIFHLPRSASQEEIKSRYYELVKLYHPDMAHGQHGVAVAVRNARFRAITHAYGLLRGRVSLNYGESRDEAMRAELRRRSRQSRPHPSASSSTSTSSSTSAAADNVHHGNVVDGQFRYIVMVVLAGMVAAFSAVSSHMDRVERHTRSAAANLTQARADAQVFGMERRRRIRERVKAFHEAEETMGGSDHSEMQKTSSGVGSISKDDCLPPWH